MAHAAQQWPTPQARDHKGQDLKSRHGGTSLAHAAQLGEFSHSSPPARKMIGGPASSPSAPTSPLLLNARFAAWLMGWSPTWTAPEPSPCGASETELWRSRLQQQLSCLFGEPASSEGDHA